MGANPDRPAGRKRRAHPGGAGLLTSREQEILRWIHLGKSNIEIGTILEISPLTVKNHVQKISAQVECSKPHSGRRQALTLRILTTESGEIGRHP